MAFLSFSEMTVLPVPFPGDVASKGTDGSLIFSLLLATLRPSRCIADSFFSGRSRVKSSPFFVAFDVGGCG